MRIAYVCYWNLLAKDGVAYKIDAQVARWRAEGHDAEVFCLTRSFGDSTDDRVRWRTFRFDSPSGRYGATRRLVRALRDWQPDAAYLRYDLFLPPVYELLRQMPAVVEVNTDDKAEAALRARRARLAATYNDVNRHLVLGRAAGLVCVTRELAESPHFARFGRQTVVIGNGIDLPGVRELPAPDNDRPRLVFLGSAGQSWHGIDKIGRLAQLMPEVDFAIVGYEPDRLGFRAPPNLEAYGALSRAEYEPLLEGSDLAIGTLALHRKNMREACPLKVREYLAHGLPVVVGYRDTDFLDEQPWFLLQLANDEENAVRGVEAIRAFLAEVRGRRVSRAEIESRIGSVAKERRRLELLTGVASAGLRA